MRTFSYFLLLLSVTFLAACSSQSADQSTEESETSIEESTAESEDSTGVYFVNLKDGDVVSSPVVIEMGVKGMIVEPKGPVKEGVGHHHLFIDDLFMEEGKFIPADSTHIHYGGGQTSDTLELAPGKYYLCLQFANGMHFSYGEPWSKGISIVVQ